LKYLLLLIQYIQHFFPESAQKFWEALEDPSLQIDKTFSKFSEVNKALTTCINLLIKALTTCINLLINQDQGLVFTLQEFGNWGFKGRDFDSILIQGILNRD
jgi:hypothetical protein